MSDFIKYNYHTHTWRCQHAYGDEREYIEAAIQMGIKRLGFSDHIATPVQPNFESKIRMRMNQTREYRDCLRALEKEYAGQIELRLGFEAEYVPEFFQEQMDMFDILGFDYLIIGQHFFNTEDVGPYTGTPTDNDERIRNYVDLLIQAMKTGRVLYIAHPDMMNFTGQDSVYEWEMGRLCRSAKEMNIPLEINVLGMAGDRQYPSKKFWRIAAAEGADAIIGLDAHCVENMVDVANYQKCVALAAECGVHLLDGSELLV